MPMPRGEGPTVQRRRLSRELRFLRERAGLTLEEAAERLGWSRSKISRIETAQSGIKPPDLRAFLDLFEITGDHREALMALNRNSRKRGWWDAYREALPSEYEDYVRLEQEASSMLAFNGMILHGLLQTEDYARAIIRAGLTSSPSGEIERRVEVRMHRQALLTRGDAALEFWSIIDEGALRRQVGGAEVMRAQHARLIELAELPNVNLQVLPFSVGAHATTASPFAILGFPPPFDAQVVYLESLNSSIYIERETDVHLYKVAYDHLRAQAMAPEASISLIAALAAEH
jgi:transcriptional regulator with XRE-family HTH domain